MEPEARRESRLRKRLQRQGYGLRKDRARNLSCDHHGGYRIIQVNGNYLVAGERFDLTLDEVEDFSR